MSDAHLERRVRTFAWLQRVRPRAASLTLVVIREPEMPTLCVSEVFIAALSSCFIQLHGNRLARETHTPSSPRPNQIQPPIWPGTAGRTSVSVTSQARLLLG